MMADRQVRVELEYGPSTRGLNVPSRIAYAQVRGLETKERVLAAATAEFAAFGVAGARINRIAEDARASKERIYAWFGDKDALFNTVMQRGLDELGRVVPIRVDLVDYTVRLYDVFTARPDLQRVATWAWLHDSERVGSLPDERLEGYRHKIDVIEQSQRAGLADAGWEPRQLLGMLITLATSWLMAPAELHQIAAGGCDSSSDSGLLRREQVRRAAERLVGPR
jgi:AcrR family transcriptional regulator